MAIALVDGRHLVEQRREQVVVAVFTDHRDVDIRLAQTNRRIQLRQSRRPV